MSRFRLLYEGQILATIKGDPLTAFGAIHRHAVCYSKDTPLVIETFQDGEWRRLYDDDEWRGVTCAD